MHNYFVKNIVEATGGTLLCGDEGVQIETVSTDSNNIGDNGIFVPIIGERVDAHRFIDGAIANGAVAVLTSEHDDMSGAVPYIRVSNTTMALQEMGHHYGETMNIPKIGITGSVGKTTTKEMIACALSAGYKVFKTSGNNNSQIGVPLTLLKISPEDEIAVIEMGMSMPGEMLRLSKLVSLDSAVVTNIGVSHIENLKSQDGICEEKFHIADALGTTGVIFLNGDDPILRAHSGELDKKIVFFGLNDNNDYRADNIEVNNGGVDFDMVVYNKETYHVRLNVLGAHNVRNALVSVAIARHYGIAPKAAIDALASYAGVSMRQQISIKNDITYIDDSYNASPDSMKAGIDVLCSVNASGRRIAVLADMLELGPDSPLYHYEVGKYICGQKIDEVILFGKLAAEIGNAVKAVSDITVTSFDTREQINEYLKDTLKANDAVLFKGSRGMKLNECADYFIKGE